MLCQNAGDIRTARTGQNGVRTCRGYRGYRDDRDGPVQFSRRAFREQFLHRDTTAYNASDRLYEACF